MRRCFIKKLVKFIKQYTFQDFMIDFKYIVLPSLTVILGWLAYIILIDILKYGLY